MAQERFTFRPLRDGQACAFPDADSAWLWFYQCQQARIDGARFSAGLGALRPCDPDDIGQAVSRLLRQRYLDQRHLAVLGRYGRMNCCPDPMLPGQQVDSLSWNEAMGHLTPVLRNKGIVL